MRRGMILCAAALLLLLPGVAAGAPVLSTEVPAGRGRHRANGEARSDDEDGGRRPSPTGAAGSRLRRRASCTRPASCSTRTTSSTRTAPTTAATPQRLGGPRSAQRGGSRDLPDRAGPPGEPRRASSGVPAPEQFESSTTLRRPRARRRGRPARAAARRDARGPVPARAHDDDARRPREHAHCAAGADRHLAREATEPCVSLRRGYPRRPRRRGACSCRGPRLAGRPRTRTRSPARRRARWLRTPPAGTTPIEARVARAAARRTCRRSRSRPGCADPARGRSSKRPRPRREPRERRVPRRRAGPRLVGQAARRSRFSRARSTRSSSAVDLRGSTVGASERWTPGPGYHERIFTSSAAISRGAAREGDPPALRHLPPRRARRRRRARR